jgi:hypothetical protein
MPEFSLFFYIAVELAVLLLIVCVFLIYHIGRQKGLVKKLEEKIISLRESLATSRAAVESVQQQLASPEQKGTKAFVEYLDEEIDNTLAYHQQLNPDRDIVLDIAPDSPIERQATSLRHAFLIAEKEARYAGEGEESNWDVLQAKLQQIVQFYESAAANVSEPSDDEGTDLEPTLDSMIDNALAESAEQRMEIAQTEVEHIESLVRDLTHEGKEMLRTIDVLESEKRGLQDKIDGDQSAENEDQQLSAPGMQKLQQDLLNLQAQHIELEERYQELKAAQ